MDVAAQKLRAGVQRVVWAQAGITVLSAIAFGFLGGGFDALSALYGGAVAIGMTWWLARQVGGMTRSSAGTGRGLVYAGAGLRFVVVLALFAFGLGVLRLAAIPLIAAFALAQFGLLAQLGRG